MEWLDDYKKLLSFPSVSSEPGYKNDLLACFEWVKGEVEKIGFTTEVWETGGHPALFASLTKAPGKPTLLLYNHYDVQPVDPVSEWHTPPFEPTVKDNIIYARGAQDNKGQLFYTLLALKTLMKEKGAFPLNIKLIIEGEEEVGSRHLPEVLEKNHLKLKADHLAIVDGGIPGEEIPAVALGMRGLVTLDVEATGSKTDLHSGSHGGLAYNPIFALCEILAAAKDRHGAITIPGFFNEAKHLPPDEVQAVSFDFNEKPYMDQFGIPASGGESALPPLQRNWLRPTFEINGITGGYTGPGFKTVIPAKASAKISCRLTKGQDPKKVGHLVARWIESMAPKGIQLKSRSMKEEGRPSLHLPIRRWCKPLPKLLPKSLINLAASSSKEAPSPSSRRCKKPPKPMWFSSASASAAIRSTLPTSTSDSIVLLKAKKLFPARYRSFLYKMTKK